mmetsp:Transcript_81337/g.263883  ORF Transcript_81337/g.263883 Transcript_81337/m.263883 type:complete len:201 (-) Transcript_81337:5599-6201(-)
MDAAVRQAAKATWPDLPATSCQNGSSSAAARSRRQRRRDRRASSKPPPTMSERQRQAKKYMCAANSADGRAASACMCRNSLLNTPGGAAAAAASAVRMIFSRAAASKAFRPKLAPISRARSSMTLGSFIARAAEQRPISLCHAKKHAILRSCSESCAKCAESRSTSVSTRWRSRRPPRSKRHISAWYVSAASSSRMRMAA